MKNLVSGGPILYRSPSGAEKIMTVSRIFENGDVRISDGKLFDKDGYRVTNSTRKYRDRVFEVEPGDVKRVKKSQYLNKIKNWDFWHCVSLEDLEKIIEIMDESLLKY